MFIIMGKEARLPAQMVSGKSTGAFHLGPLGHIAKSHGGHGPQVFRRQASNPKMLITLTLVKGCFSVRRLIGFYGSRKSLHPWLPKSSGPVRSSSPRLSR